MADDDKGISVERHILVMLGRIEGELKGLNKLVVSTSDSTNKRIDDLKESINQRVDDLSVDTDKRFEDIQKQISRKGATAGGASAAIVAGMAEIIRLVLKG